MNNYSLTDITTELGKPYSFRLKSRRWWCIADRFGHEYEILYEDHPIRVLETNNIRLVKDIVDLLNIAYNVGAVDAVSLINRYDTQQIITATPHEEPTI